MARMFGSINAPLTRFALSRRAALKITLAVTAFGMACEADASTSANPASAMYATLAAQAQYASSGYISAVTSISGTTTFFSEGSATLIAPGWVLTAAHVVTPMASPQSPYSTITFGQGATGGPVGTLTVASTVVDPSWSYGVDSGFDIALVKLSTPIINASTAPLYNGAAGSEKGQLATIIGYGLTGSGTTGETSGTYGTRLAIQNTIDAYGGDTVTEGNGTPLSLSNFNTDLMLTDFDQAGVPNSSLMGSTTPSTNPADELSYEGASTHGDSGGGLFLTVNGITYLAGVTSGVGPTNVSPAGQYGSFNDYSMVGTNSALYSFISSTLAVAGTWSGTGGGSWATPANWNSGNIPQFVSATASFNSSISADANITLDDKWTVGSMTFNSGHNYTLSAGNNGSLAIQSLITVSLGNDIISAPVTTLASSTTVNITNGSSSLRINGAISGAGLGLSGIGTLTLGAANSYTKATTVSGGVLEIAAAGALPANNTLAISGGKVVLDTNTGIETLSSSSFINGSGKLDIGNNHILISYAGGSDPRSLFQGYVATGANGGAWNGVGIDSSAAAANSGYGVAFADGADGIAGGLTSGQIEIAYALLGDIKLTGAVNALDFGILAGNFGKSVTGGWEQGDLNYDGVVNAIDFGDLAGNFGKSATGTAIALSASDWAALDSFAAANGLLADVPEPASVGILSIASMTLLARRRGRTQIHS